MADFFYYKIYGLRVRSSESLPYLIPSLDTEYDTSINITYQPADNHPHCESYIGAVYTSDGLNHDGTPYLSIWKQHSSELHLIAKYTNGVDVATFTSDKGGLEINIYLTNDVRFYDMIAYLYGPILGCILRLKSKTCIHGGVININGKAVIITGHKEAGKSTLMASLAAKGYAVLSDDIATLSFVEDDCFVLPGYPCLRLWNDTVLNVLNYKVEQLDPVLSFTDKYYLPLATDVSIDDFKFQETKVSLGAIYFLNHRNVNNILSITRVSEYEAVRGLLQNAYAGYMLEGMSTASEFSLLSRLVKNIKVSTLDSPDDISYMNEVCTCLINDNA